MVLQMATADVAAEKALDERVPVTVGVLSIQGSFAEHVSMLEREGAGRKDALRLTAVEVRSPSQLERLDGLIIPGGESTTLSVFLRQNDFQEKLKSFTRDGERTVWGTCAGLILLSNQLDSQKRGGQVTVRLSHTHNTHTSHSTSPTRTHTHTHTLPLCVCVQLGGIDIQCTRNAYGKQINSFEAPIKLRDPALHHKGHQTHTPCDEYPGIFIRAPGIEKLTSPHVQTLATLPGEGGRETVVGVRQGNLMATSFHPELTPDSRWHSYFIDMILTQNN